MRRQITAAQKAALQPAMACGRVERVVRIVLLDGTHYAGRPPVKAVCRNGDEFRIEPCGRSILLSTSPSPVLVDCMACVQACRRICAVIDPETRACWSLAVRAAAPAARKPSRRRKTTGCEQAADAVRVTA